VTAGRGRPRSFDRDEALERAMVLFWQRGYDAVGTRDLAEAMGIVAPSLYNAFTNKQTLFEEAVEVYARRYGGYIEESLAGEPDARRAVAALLSGAARQHTLPDRPAGCLIINGATNHTPAAAEVAAGLRARRAHVAALIKDKIQTDIDEGTLPRDTDAGHLATYVVTVWRGLSLSARDGASRNDLEAAVRTAMNAWPAPAHSTPPPRC
jgi:AcrR family transcriptional regulator